MIKGILQVNENVDQIMYEEMSTRKFILFLILVSDYEYTWF